MPIQVEWDNDTKTLIRWNFVGNWTAQELRETIIKSNEMINAQDHTVNHIIDLLQAKGLPGNIINETRYAMRQMPKNLGRVVIVAEGAGFELLGDAMKRFSWFSDKAYYAHSDAEARTILGGHNDAH